MTVTGTSMSDMQAVFGGAKATGSEEVGSAVNPQNGVSAGNQSLTGADKSVVSATGDAMLQAMGTSDVRMDKVASLQAAIASGSYQVSSSDVADSLIESMLG